jgi:hypothetical protein
METSAVAEDLLGYEQLTQEAMRGVVRAALQRAAGPNGLPGRHHFYITFRTQAPGVTIPAQMLSRYPEEMTIVLEHQFWDLEVLPDHFRVILKFSGSPSHVVVPFAAVSRFYDPSVRFGLQFEPTAEDVDAKGEPQDEAPAPEPQREAAAGGAASPSVVSLDAFRKK